jgi:hypothetical protein
LDVYNRMWGVLSDVKAFPGASARLEKPGYRYVGGDRRLPAGMHPGPGSGMLPGPGRGWGESADLERLNLACDLLPQIAVQRVP